MDKAAKNQEEKALRFVKFCIQRFQTDATDDQIAKQLGFESAEVLYERLELDGSPVCGVCGRLYPEPDHQEEHKARRKRRQPGVGGGHRVKLPDAKSARDLFRTALEGLELSITLAEAEESWLEGNIEEDGFRGKRFITHNVDRNAIEIARREEYTPEHWRELCEQHGVDPDRDRVALSRGEATPGGVSRTPSMFLTALIAAYALAPSLFLPFSDHKLKPLVEALHQEPELAAWDERTANVEELRKVAGHLATRVRGGVVGRGRGVEEVSREEHYVAWLIRALDEEGIPSDEAALEHLKKTFRSLSEGLTVKDIDRIRRARLEPPE